MQKKFCEKCGGALGETNTLGLVLPGLLKKLKSAPPGPLDFCEVCSLDFCAWLRDPVAFSHLRSQVEALLFEKREQTIRAASDVPPTEPPAPMPSAEALELPEAFQALLHGRTPLAFATQAPASAAGGEPVASSPLSFCHGERP